MPLTESLVVCGLLEVIEIFSPNSLFMREDLPTLGLPMIAAKPHLKLSIMSINHEKAATETA
jgi:hypothetical protein